MKRNENNAPGRAGQEAELLARNIGLLLENRQEITGNPELCGCCIDSASLALPNLRGRRLSLGQLLDLWGSGKWTEECPACGGRVYIAGTGCSSNSNGRGWWGVCGQCQAHLRGSRDKFYELYAQFVSQNPKGPDCPGISFGEVISFLRPAA
jgi:hypothetical protein